MCALHHFAFDALNNLWDRERRGKYNPALFGLEWQVKDKVEQYRKALNMSPKEFVGDSFDPDKKECQEMRNLSKWVYEKFMSEKYPEEKK
jgi:hypothetical protein